MAIKLSMRASRSTSKKAPPKVRKASAAVEESDAYYAESKDSEYDVPVKHRAKKQTQQRRQSPVKRNTKPVAAAAGSVTESEHSSDLIFVDMPGTQHVPVRRNKGSLDLYSEGKVSDLGDSEDNSAERDLQKWVQERQGLDPTRQSPSRKRPERVRKAYESSEDDNEMTYQGALFT